MNINDFQNLSREEQFKAAGSIAGIEPSTFDGLWRTESGRGANMLGPVTKSGDRAEGHYQLMPKTRKTMEQRFGAVIDPYNFGQSLYTAAHLMKENMGRFKNLPDSLRAYNGGWNPATWGNKETAAYAGKVLGTDDDSDAIEGSTVEAVASGSVGRLAVSSARDLWDTPFQTVQKPARAVAPSKVSAAIAEVAAATSAPVKPTNTLIFGATTAEAAAATAKATKEKDETGLLEMSRAAAFREPFNATARWMFRDDEPVDPAYVPDEAMMKGKTVSEQQDLRSATSKKQADRMLFDQEYGKEQDAKAFLHGTLGGIGATLIAELPAAFASGGLASLGARGLGVGATTLAAEGRFGAALASSTVEGIVGNVATTALLDSIGERQGATAYAMGVAGGLLNPLLMGRGLGRAADRATARATTARLIEEVAAKEAALMEKAKARVGEDAAPEDVRATMDIIEAEGLRADKAAATASVPESRKLNVGDEVDLVPEGAADEVVPAEAKAAVEADDAALVAKVESEARGEVAVVEPTPAEVEAVIEAVGEVAVLREGLTAIPEAAPIVKAIDDAIEEVVPTAAPVLPLAEVAPKLGKTKGQGELYPLTPKEKKEIADLRAKADAEAMVEVPNGKVVPDGQAELDFTVQLSPEEAMVQGINGKSIIEAAEWAVANAPPELAVIAQRALAQLRHLQDAGMIVGKVEVTQPGYTLRNAKGLTNMAHPGGFGNSPSTVSIKLNHFSNGEQSGVRPETLVHELFHAATMASIQMGNKLAAKGTVLAQAVDDLYKVHNDLIKHFNARVKSGDELTAFEQAVLQRNNNAMADVDESLTWALTNKDMQAYLETIPYKKGTMWSEFVKGVRNLLGMSPSQDTMLSEYLRIGEEVTSMKGADLQGVKDATGKQFSTNNSAKAMPQKLVDEINAFIMDPVAIKHGLDRMPMGTNAERAEAKQVLALYRKADSAEYVVDEKRLSWLLKHAPAFSPTSNIMLRSKNPVMRMAALELLENGGGAGGRRSTAAIAKHMNERAIVGNAVVDLDRHFNTWFKTQPGASHLKEGLDGTKRGQFSRLIAEEIEQRRLPQQRTDLGQSVRDAADAVELSFERARLMQIDAKTVGWAALPESSRGYMPHRIKSATYRSLSDSQVRALHGELTDQFIMGSGFDPTFADQLASRYLDRVNARALGGFDSPMGLHQTGASDVVREALEAADMTRPEIDAVMKRYAAGGAGHTKKRLNLDLSKEITTDDGKSFRLMDLYDTDMLSLVRSQSQRVSGEVALARHGVMGKPGLAIMRRAMGFGGQAEKLRPDGVEIGAFDQVSSEFLGSPMGTANKYVDRATQLNSLMSLGGMGINQFAEIINEGFTLGFKAVAQHVTGFGRLRGEIAKLARGEAVDNGLLKHIEFMGGAEFGTDAHKMVFPLDNPDLFANSMGGDTLHAGDRILRGAGHLQSKLSLWRTIHSTQVRGVAEQIVMKASRAIKDGVNDYHLRDMGMSDEVFAKLKADMPNIAKYDAKGNLVEFDITKATDKEAANAFIQGVHRGASQIIQGTFIGESGKYVHNSWLRMLSQFRTFSLTAIDKQFNRQVGNRGVMGALMMTLGSMSMAAPIYYARTYAASIGRADQDEYLEKYTSFGATARATTNYIATAGLAGDFLDAFTAVTGTGEVTGGRTGTNSTFIGNMVAPAAGKIDKVWGAVQNTKDGTDVHGLLREMPLSRLPWFIPAINALGD